MRHLIQLCLLVALMMALPARLKAQFYYNTNSDNSINISGYYGSGGNVFIPESINSLPVTTIGTGAFSGYSGLTSITIPNGVLSIGNNAFGGCSGLTNAVIGNQVTSLGQFAFGECFDLVTVTIPESVTSFGEEVFESCSSLTSVTIPSSLATVGDSAFFACSGLTNVIISDGIASIGNEAFKNCPSLTDITIPNSVTNIGDYAFDSCFSLSNVSIGTNVANIGEYAFANTALTNINFPGSVVSVEDHAFDYCFNLKGIFFYGNAPGFAGPYVFAWGPANPVYYLRGTIGWGAWFGDRPTALWLPAIQPNNATFVVQTNQFGFNINWASGQTVVVEACTNLSNPDWQPVQTNMLTTGSAYFSDPQWTNYSGRFYRLCSP